MSHSDEQGHGPTRPPEHLDVLRLDPTLARLASSGWQLDRLPVTSVAWTFAGALLTALLAFGTLGTAPLVVGLVVAVGLVGSALMVQDVDTARTVLTLTRAALTGWIFLGAVCLH